MMKRTPLLFILISFLIGGLGGWQYDAQVLHKAPTVKPTSSIPAGFKNVTVAIPGGGLQVTIRETDQITRLKNEDKLIGYKIFDSFAQQGGATVDVITDRLAEFYDLPEAKDLAAYKEPVIGLTIRETREANIAGHAALKQLYDATLGQKRSDGAVIKKPVPNLMRYIIQGNDDQFLILKSPASFQKYLDTVAVSIRFVAAPKTGDESVIDLGNDDSINDVLPTENPLINGGDALPL